MKSEESSLGSLHSHLLFGQLLEGKEDFYAKQ
jgi:hypothetical protein